jgi:hypothetical protein
VAIFFVGNCSWTQIPVKISCQFRPVVENHVDVGAAHHVPWRIKISMLIPKMAEDAHVRY